MKTLLQINGNNTSKIDQGSMSDKDLYLDILNVRNDPYNHSNLLELAYPFDFYSDHYRLMVDGITAGALTVTQARNGTIDCEEYIPKALVENFREVICSACKFRVIKQRIKHIEKRSKMELPMQVLKSAYKDQLNKGSRLDIINAHKTFSRYYTKMGYLPIENSDFIHPVLGTESIIMYLPVDPSRKTAVQDLFAQYDDPLMLSEVQRILTKTPVYLSLSAA